VKVLRELSVEYLEGVFFSEISTKSSRARLIRFFSMSLMILFVGMFRVRCSAGDHPSQQVLSGS
jgi:hypothetical protein